MADSSSELLINIIVIFLVLLSYVVPFLLRSLKKKRERDAQRRGPGPVETIEKTFSSLETVLSGDVADDEEAPAGTGSTVEQNTAEAASIDAAARAALRDAAALTEKLRGQPHLDALAPLVEREIMAPLEQVRKAAAVFMKNPGALAAEGDFLFSGHAAVMDGNGLIQSLEEIAAGWRAGKLVRRALPTIRIAEAFFGRLGSALSDVYPVLDRFVPVAVPSQHYGAAIQNPRLTAAGLLLYPASTEPAVSPMDYSVPVFYLAANAARAFVTDAALEAAGLATQARPTMVILAGHYVTCSLLGPAYVDAMRTVKGELFSDEELEACRRALADQPMSLSRRDGAAQEAPASESAASWGEALVSLPLFADQGLRVLADRSPLRFERSALDKVSDSLVAQADDVTEKNPVILLIGAMLAAARYPEAAGRLARTLDSLLRGERPQATPRRAKAEAAAHVAAHAAAGAPLRSDELVDAIVLGAFWTPPRSRGRRGFHRPPGL